MDRIGYAKNLLTIRDQGVAPINSLKKSWRRIVVRIAISALCFYLYFMGSGSPVFLLAIGAVLGAAGQDIGWILKVSQVWPYTEEVIDWDKVDKIASEQ